MSSRKLAIAGWSVSARVNIMDSRWQKGWPKTV